METDEMAGPRQRRRQRNYMVRLRLWLHGGEAV
jgi:hypothetical protein